MIELTMIERLQAAASMCADAHRTCMAAADRIAELEAEREGKVLVPREPTEAMLEAGIHAPMPAVLLDSINGQAKLRLKAKYKTMLKAAEAGDGN